MLRSIALSAGLLVLPGAAFARQPASPQPLQVERIDNGFVIAPDAKLTEVNREFATLAGVNGGWLTDRTLLVGGGAYWLANGDEDREMRYVGGLVRWTFGGHRRLGFSVGSLVGGGDATLSRTYGDLFDLPVGTELSTGRHSRFGRAGGRITSDTLVRVSDGFFIAEPQVNAIWNLTRWMRLDAGVGYRVVAGSEFLGDELRGVSGSIAVQFGGR